MPIKGVLIAVRGLPLRSSAAGFVSVLAFGIAGFPGLGATGLMAAQLEQGREKIQSLRANEARLVVAQTKPGNKLDLGDLKSFFDNKQSLTDVAKQQPPTNTPLSDADKQELISTLQGQMERCYTIPSSHLAYYGGARPVISVKLNQDGTLKAEPTIVNTGSDGDFQALAASAIRAVRRCAPYAVPARFQGAYAQWKEIHAQFHTGTQKALGSSIEDRYALGVINPAAQGDICFYRDGDAAERVLDQSTKAIGIQFPQLKLRILQQATSIHDVIQRLADGSCAAAIVPTEDIAIIGGAPSLSHAQLSVLDGNIDPELRARREQRDRERAEAQRVRAERLAERERTRPERQRKQMETFGVLLASVPREIACGANLRCGEPLPSIRMIKNFADVLETIGRRVSRKEQLVSYGAIISSFADGCREGAYSILEAYEGYETSGVGQQFPMSDYVPSQTAACNAAIAEINRVAQSLDIVD